MGYQTTHVFHGVGSTTSYAQMGVAKTTPNGFGVVEPSSFSLFKGGLAKSSSSSSSSSSFFFYFIPRNNLCLHFTSKVILESFG
jgi:hypothetical protein